MQMNPIRWPRKNVVRGLAFASVVGAVLSLAIAIKFFRGQGGEQLGLPEILLLGFWALGPPIALFLEYVLWPPDSKDEDRTKHIHDLARNIWIVFLVVLAMIMGVDSPWN